MALINFFFFFLVKLWNNPVLVCNNGKSVAIKLLRTVLIVNFAYFNLNMD